MTDTLTMSIQLVPAALSGLFSKRDVQRCRRALRRAYLRTHHLLAQVAMPELTAALAADWPALAALRAQVEVNVRRAEVGQRLAACLPLSRLGRKVRREADDNLSVAFEAKEVFDRLPAI